MLISSVGYRAQRRTHDRCAEGQRLVSLPARSASCWGVPTNCLDRQIPQRFVEPMPRSNSQFLDLPTASGALARLAAQEAGAAGLDRGAFLRAACLTAAQIHDADERMSVEASAQPAFGCEPRLGR